MLVLKPESVLQRALEVGYRGITDNCKFKVCKFILSYDVKRIISSLSALNRTVAFSGN